MQYLGEDATISPVQQEKTVVAPSLAEVPKSGNNVCLLVETFVNPSCNLNMIRVAVSSLKGFPDETEWNGRTTRRVGYFVQKVFSPSGDDICSTFK